MISRSLLPTRVVAVSRRRRIVGYRCVCPMAWRRTKRALALSLCNDRIVSRHGVRRTYHACFSRSWALYRKTAARTFVIPKAYSTDSSVPKRTIDSTPVRRTEMAVA